MLSLAMDMKEVVEKAGDSRILQRASGYIERSGMNDLCAGGDIYNVLKCTIRYWSATG